MATQKFKTTLREQMDDQDGKIKPLPIRVEVNGNENILIRAKGYGDFCSADGEGYPILIEQGNGVLRVVIWGDINQEDPTHIIELGDAKESNREPEEVTMGHA